MGKQKIRDVVNAHWLWSMENTSSDSFSLDKMDISLWTQFAIRLQAIASWWWYFMNEFYSFAIYVLPIPILNHKRTLIALQFFAITKKLAEHTLQENEMKITRDLTSIDCLLKFIHSSMSWKPCLSFTF